LAGRHGVAGILLHNLAKPCAANADAWQLAGRFVRAKQVQSLRVRRYGAELLERMTAAGILAAGFKGADFADHLYPLPSVRPTTDIDLLVPRNCLRDTTGVLERLGYRKAAVKPMRFAASEYGEESWRHATAADVEVDLHWNLINHPSLRRRASVEFNDLDWQPAGSDAAGQVRATPATRLIIAAAHATFGHQFDRLLLLCDIREACRQLNDADDVADVAHLATRTGTRAALDIALATTTRWLGAAAVTDLRRRLRGRAITGGASLLISEQMLLHSGGQGHYVRRRLFRELLKRAA